ncbi:hypothetical protein CH252_33405 [Rhodococcus sp. 06-1477-1B]|uniref:uracil-DNA glycosylase n=1 Tax=Rhodococcus sp. 06-1474-1B TaxID=2022499 RepID=UPI000B9AF40E|nr:uracil-DNA glycosylase [Rhodococcus sp. 06-1474-1B]OZD37385.1 hypothetical protein CH252_33405 [Rhodococcus sp. 06-1477-1B]OZD46273.1 hypothetical protein CH266_21650 [Rhodococcus sp. 06-1474-1B]
MARQMRMRSYQREQMNGKYLPHIEPFNRLVDDLRTVDEWMPYVAPIYGGRDALVLALFRDPGPATRDGVGSGMLCVENDDPSAERHCNFLRNAGIAASDLMVWNTYPWFINRKPTSAEIDRGLPVLRKILELCPNVEVVMAHGGDAQLAWRRLRRRIPNVAAGIETIETHHTSRQALWHKDSDVRTSRERKLAADFGHAANVLGGAPH